MKALQNCIIIERDVDKHPLFVLPQTEKLGTGIAISIGPKCLDIKVGDHVYFDVGQEFKHDDILFAILLKFLPYIKVGDHVYFDVGQEFKQDGKEYVVMREPHILGVLE